MRKERALGIKLILLIFLIVLVGIFLWGNYKEKTDPVSVSLAEQRHI
ncbi:hypothetical protein [Cohnella phaseoli]|uniref:Uncharacterized protein n=1 Tax=Cohnella phaseoli TaxID=456490 RepID=A0A3D9JQ61_9BACL|nr:hypothetical protein [Cohnella phaseoli]RED76090.1 hypothetical protein DFP98_113150 [Cohnella phaseoli]